MRRATCIASLLVVAGSFCGGKLVVGEPRGHKADDGGYVLSDGAPAYMQGSGCAAYKSALPICTWPYGAIGCDYGWTCNPADSASAAEACASVARSALPPGYPFYATCMNNSDRADIDPGHCQFNSALGYWGVNCSNWYVATASPVLACNLGVDGDAFCRAFMSQFVLGDGVVNALCIPACEKSVAYDGMCWSTTAEQTTTGPVVTGNSCATGPCGGLDMCVTRNGQSVCEPPCMTPQ